MKKVEDEGVTLASTGPTKVRPRPLHAIFLAVFTAQYTIIAICVSLSAASTMHYLVVPQIVAKFEAIATALRR